MRTEKKPKKKRFNDRGANIVQKDIDNCKARRDATQECHAGMPRRDATQNATQGCHAALDFRSNSPVIEAILKQSNREGGHLD